MDSSSIPAVSRRESIAASVALVGSLAGCLSVFDDSSSKTPETTAAGTATTRAGTEPTPAPLHVQTSSMLHTMVQEAAIAWNRNPELSDGRWESTLDTAADGRLADYFCRREGLEPTGERSNPPVPIVISHANGTAVVRNLGAGRVDLGETGYEPAGAISESLMTEDRFVGHRLATAGSAFLVSPPLVEVGVTSLRAAELRDIYAGEIANWRAVGGPDREIRVVAGADATPSDWLRDEFFENRPEAGVDVRFGKATTRIERIESRDDAIGEVLLGFADADLPVIDVGGDGTRYVVGEPGYPASVTLECYTWGEPDPRERAFVAYLQSAAGQRFADGDRDLIALDWEPDSDAE